MGPVWAYWAFLMECHCGDILHNVRSQRFPYANINKYVTSCAQLTHITLLYGLHDKLNLLPPVCHGADVKLPSCKFSVRLMNSLTYQWARSIICSYPTQGTCGDPLCSSEDEAHCHPSHLLEQVCLNHSGAYTPEYSIRPIWSCMLAGGWWYYACSWLYPTQIWQSRYVICPGKSPTKPFHAYLLTHTPVSTCCWQICSSTM
jgi:hypothetical protein